MSIKSKIEALIARRGAVLKTFREENDKLEAYWNDPANPFSDEEKKKALYDAKREMNANRIKVDHSHKQEFKKLISEEIDRIKGMAKGDDGASAALTNALSTINMIGDNLNDETAFSLIKPFIGDYRAMHTLRLALNNKHNINGTLGALSVPDEQIKRLNDIADQCAESLFNSGAYSPILFPLAAGQMMDALDACETLNAGDITSETVPGATPLSVAVGNAVGGAMASRTVKEYIKNHEAEGGTNDEV